jgi:hypothetical protein
LAASSRNSGVNFAYLFATNNSPFQNGPYWIRSPEGVGHPIHAHAAERAGSAGFRSPQLWDLATCDDWCEPTRLLRSRSDCSAEIAVGGPQRAGPVGSFGDEDHKVGPVWGRVRDVCAAAAAGRRPSP